MQTEPEEQHSPPPIKLDAPGQINTSSLADIIQWFMERDQRVAVIRHPSVEELFHWKQNESKSESEDVFIFDHAEDRLAIGIIQALMQNTSERELHGWISQLLNTLDEASKVNEEIAGAYKLETEGGASVIQEAAKIPSRRERSGYLISCWLETLCTAEVRVLGWVYQELYGRPFRPDNY
ncbi:MAG TPA: hypothetical protein VJS44_14870 [Pyrinomonadaceae bacterium]|nr:hypothetical protein [Pyrinomonadaceae bacterium]